MKKIEKKDSFICDIPSGYKSFKNNLKIEFNKGLNVITGINGSGKTQLLEYIYFNKINKNNNDNILLRKNNNFEIKEKFKNYDDRYLSKYEYNYQLYYESKDINSILNEIEKVYDRIIIKNNLSRNFIYPSAVYNAIFVKDNFLYNFKINNTESFRLLFFKEILKILSNNINISQEKVGEDFGIISTKKLEEKLKNKLLATKQYKNKRDKNLKEKINEYMKDYNKNKDIIEIEESFFNAKNKIKNKNELINYIENLLTPLNTIDSIITKISNMIYNEVTTKARKKEKIWIKINDILSNSYYDDKFNYILEEPDSRINYKITFRHKNKNLNEIIPFENLSSGEKIIFELICYVFIIEFNGKKNKTKMILLDEFDANLNPQLSELFINVIRRELINKNIDIILTTHSPSTVAVVEPKELYFMNNNNGIHECKNAIDENGKKNILEKLAPNFIYEKELGFFGILAKTNKKYIIFVEGKTDKIHLETAIECLNLEKNYEFIDCSGAENIVNIINVIKDIEIFNNLLSNKIIIALFDFDNEGCTAASRIIDKEYMKKVNSDPKIKYAIEIHDKIFKRNYLVFNNIKKNNKSLNINIMLLQPPKNSNFWETFNFSIECLYNIDGYYNNRNDFVSIIKKKDKNNIIYYDKNMSDYKYDNLSFNEYPEYYEINCDKNKFVEHVKNNKEKFNFNNNFRELFNIINNINNLCDN